jgi:hypothetical protein
MLPEIVFWLQFNICFKAMFGTKPRQPKEYRLDDSELGVRFPIQTRDFSNSLYCTDRLWNPTRFLTTFRGDSSTEAQHLRGAGDNHLS